MESVHGFRTLSRGSVARAIRILERSLSANGVDRASDLPEEARVRLYRRLSRFFEEERAAHWSRQMRTGPFRRALAWLRARLHP